jgi:hypothetical protein
MFSKNVNSLDRAVRAAAGIALVAGGTSLCLTRHRVSGGLAGLIGLTLLGTAAAAWCPIYKSLGFSTVN